MNARAIRVALALTALTLVPQARAADLKLPRDGWAAWQVAAVEGAPDWCCWSSGGDQGASKASCRLDEDAGNFGSRDHQTTDNVRVYVRLAGGKVERLRVLSVTCPVEAKTPIQEIDRVTVDDSARWFATHARSSEDKGDNFRENLLAGLAMHRGDLAQSALTEIARGDGSFETRKKSVFWLAMVRGAPGAEVVSSVMFNDQNPDMRQHASFALAQTKSARVTQDLIRLGNTDKDGEVRAQAWFWLAHTGASESEAAISAALKKDQDDQVREKAVFALSQLPDDRATRALVAVAEDRALSHEQRKRAVFWLARSEADGAQQYLEKVLVGNARD